MRVPAAGPVLATAGTNAAAENLLEGLAEIPGMRAVRVGQPASVREGLRHLSLAALAEATPEGQKVQTVVKWADIFAHSPTAYSFQLSHL